METPLSRMDRRRRKAKGWAVHVGRDDWGPLLLAGISLVVGVLFQDPVRYGWVAGAVAAMLTVRMAVTFEPPSPDEAREPLPLASLGAFVRGGMGLAVAALLYGVVPSIHLTPAWALLGLGLILLGRGAGEYPLRMAGTLTLLLAVGHAIAIDSFPDFEGAPPSLRVGDLLLRFEALRQINFAVTGLSGLAALWCYRPASGERAVRDGLMVVAHLGILWGITYEIADAIEMTRGAASAGNETLWIAAAWGVYGLLLVLTAPLVSRELSWLKTGQAVLTFALGYLLMGGMMAQARWADAPVRFAAYAGVPGAILLAAWVQERRGRLTEPDRLLALAALAMTFGICSFEVERWLEPLFTYPDGTVPTPAMLEQNRSLLSGLALGLWTLYCLLALWVGSLLGSRSARFMVGVLGASTVLYLLFWLVL
ncbi:MAG: hypothetical protein ACOY94_14185 [Bacillota bacterium]